MENLTQFKKSIDVCLFNWFAMQCQQWYDYNVLDNCLDLVKDHSN